MREETKGRVIDLIRRNAAVYDVISALRGPDTKDADDLKFLFTARLRAVVKISAYATGGTVRAGVMTGIPAGRALDQATAWRERDAMGYKHYLGHINLAAAQLGERDLETLALAFRDEPWCVTTARIIEMGGGDA